MGRYKNIPIKQLIEFSKEHLFYEIDMLYGLAEHLERDYKEFEDGYVYNGLLESWVIHASIILDFFYKPQMKPDDAKAIHYIDNVTAWKKSLPKFESYFRLFHRKRSREVVHLSYSRLELKAEDKRWRVAVNTGKIRKIVDLFLKHADPKRIDPQLLQLKSS